MSPCLHVKLGVRIRVRVTVTVTFTLKVRVLGLRLGSGSGSGKVRVGSTLAGQVNTQLQAAKFRNFGFDKDHWG